VTQIEAHTTVNDDASPTTMTRTNPPLGRSANDHKASQLFGTTGTSPPLGGDADADDDDDEASPFLGLENPTTNESQPSAMGRQLEANSGVGKPQTMRASPPVSLDASDNTSPVEV